MTAIEVHERALAAGRAAYVRHAWPETYAQLTEADAAGPLEADDLAALAEAAWWTGRLGESIEARERAFSAYLAVDRPDLAAHMALLLAADLSHGANRSMSAGWVRRAERLLADLPEAEVHAYLARTHVSAAMGRGELDDALKQADRELEIGMRLGDRDLQSLGLHDRGRVLIAKGEVDEGLALLDEAMVSAVSGELSPFPTAVIYCNVIIACQDLADYQRAGDYTEAARRWCERQAIAGFPGMCRVRRAEVVRLRGAWAEAEQEARRASAELKDFYLDFAGEGFYQVGEIRLRMGDLATADDAFRQAHELGRDPQPGLALLLLAQGDADAALAMLRRTLGDETLVPLARARLLPALVEVALAADRVDEAAPAVVELESIADGYRTAALAANALAARGALALASGDADAAATPLRGALQQWKVVDAPYEAARTRLLLAEAYAVQGDREAARLEAGAAQAAFERLGALPDLRRAMAHAGGDRDHVPPGPAAAERAVRTFLFTDIVRSTDLLEAIGDDAWRDILRWHDETLRGLFAQHGGEEVDHAGDGFFVAFPTVAEALACAVAVQRALATHRRAHGFAPEVRIGLHSAAATRAGRSYSGRGVHVAARIAALAAGGEILASTNTLADDREANAYRTSTPRAVPLKGIREPVEVATVSWR